MERLALSKHAARPLLAVALAMTLLSGCLTPGARSHSYRYFREPAVGDPWSAKIAGWQSRERMQARSLATPSPAEVSGSGWALASTQQAPDGNLREKYFAFRSERKREMARDLARWIQKQAKRHYVADGPLDHWATFHETLEHNGDDCDGLELLVYHALLDLGIARNRVFRAIVYRPSDGQHHMVTLWFENREDPWVIDPTGAMTSGMPRMSKVPGWVPLKLFSETEEFTVERVRRGLASAR